MREVIVITRDVIVVWDVYFGTLMAPKWISAVEMYSYLQHGIEN